MQSSSNNDNDDCGSKNNNIKQPEKETIQNIIPFWSENPNILLNNDFLFEFFPVESMSFEQKLNAISRTIILLSLVTFFYTKSIRILFIGGVSSLFHFHAPQVESHGCQGDARKEGRGVRWISYAS